MTKSSTEILLPKILKFLLQIPKGQVSTYKEIALACNSKSYRFIGKLLGKNPSPVKIPCHRIVCSDGKIGGYSASGSIKRKIELLTEEGIIIKNNKVQNLEELLFREFKK